MRNYTEGQMFAKIITVLVIVIGVAAAVFVWVSLVDAGGMASPAQYAQHVGRLYGDPHPRVVSVTRNPAFEGAPPSDDITISGHFRHGQLTTRYIHFSADGPEAATASSVAIGVQVWDLYGFNQFRNCSNTPQGFYPRCWRWYDPVPSHHCPQSITHDVAGCFGPPIRSWFDYLVYRDIPDTFDSDSGLPASIRIRLKAAFPAGRSKEYVVGYTYRSSLRFQRNALTYAIDTGSSEWGAGSGVVGCIPSDYADSRSKVDAERRAAMKRSVVVDLNVNPQNAPDPALAYGWDYTGRARFLRVSQPGLPSRRVPITHHMFMFAFRTGKRLAIQAFDSGHKSVHVFVVHDPYCGP